MTSSEKSLLRMARKAISQRKFAVAAAYLDELPDCPQVRSAREYLRSFRAEIQSYDSMSRDERDAHDNK